MRQLMISKLRNSFRPARRGSIAFFLHEFERLEFKKIRIYITNTLAVFRNLIARRLQWEPVAYITGRKEFWVFHFEVNNSVLIPRPVQKSLWRNTGSYEKYESPLMKQPQSNTGSVRQKWHPIWIPASPEWRKAAEERTIGNQYLDIGTGSGAIALL